MNPLADALGAVRSSRQLQDLKLRHGRDALVAAWNTLPSERRAVIKLMAAFDGIIIEDGADDDGSARREAEPDSAPA